MGKSCFPLDVVMAELVYYLDIARRRGEIKQSLRFLKLDTMIVRRNRIACSCHYTDHLPRSSSSSRSIVFHLVLSVALFCISLFSVFCALQDVCTLNLLDAAITRSSYRVPALDVIGRALVVTYVLVDDDIIDSLQGPFSHLKLRSIDQLQDDIYTLGRSRCL